MATQDRNALGGTLESRSLAPHTRFYRGSYCNTGSEDVGLHVVCVQVAAEFLAFARAHGNDLVTPFPRSTFLA